MKKIGYINGQRVKGSASNVARIKAVKRAATGAVSLTAAPTTKYTKTGLGATKTTTVSPTIGLTGTAGGRNFIKGKFSAINTNATKKVTMTVLVKTLGGTATLKKSITGTHTAKTTTSNTAPVPIGVPGTVIIKAKPTAGKVGTIKAGGISVNALTTMLM
ncbi:MAG: hypothetical protein ACTSYX_05530 [Candidatus Thorarchaeota archaeon]